MAPDSFKKKHLTLEKDKNKFGKGLDRKAFEQLFKKNFKGLSYFALEYVKDLDIAREIVQDAFTSLWEKRSTIETDRAPEAYMSTTVRNRCLNYLRDNKKFNSDILELEGLDTGHEYSYQDHLVTDELKTRIEQAISELPEKCREIFLLNRMEKKKYQEIADILDISVKTVEAQMSKALRIMREKLAEFISIILIIIDFLIRQ